MSRYVKIGPDVFSLDAVTRISVVEARSGISDRILITLGESEVTVDSAIGGRERMEKIQARLMEALQPQDWDEPEPAAAAPASTGRSALFQS